MKYGKGKTGKLRARGEGEGQESREPRCGLADEPAGAKDPNLPRREEALSSTGRMVCVCGGRERLKKITFSLEGHEIGGAQSVFPRPAAATWGDRSEARILRPHPDLWQVEPGRRCFHKPCRCF